jgi:hypothetical protein
MDLSRAATPDLERLRSALAGQRLSFPLSRAGLQGEGLEVLAEHAPALNAAGREGALALVSAVLAERASRPHHPELVWTGPEPRSSGARDTAVVLADLFRRATSRVLLAGFAFDHAAEVLRPLHESLERGVSCRLFADAEVAARFTREHWPFGPPFPEVYGFAPESGRELGVHHLRELHRPGPDPQRRGRRPPRERRAGGGAGVPVLRQPVVHPGPLMVGGSSSAAPGQRRRRIALASARQLTPDL